jgi:hypothetical protein
MLRILTLLSFVTSQGGAVNAVVIDKFSIKNSIFQNNTGTEGAGIIVSGNKIIFEDIIVAGNRHVSIVSMTLGFLHANLFNIGSFQNIWITDQFILHHSPTAFKI